MIKKNKILINQQKNINKIFNNIDFEVNNYN